MICLVPHTLTPTYAFTILIAAINVIKTLFALKLSKNFHGNGYGYQRLCSHLLLLSQIFFGEYMAALTKHQREEE